MLTILSYLAFLLGALGTTIVIYIALVKIKLI